MVGARKKRKPSPTGLPQLKVGGIYHSRLYGDDSRSGHYVVIGRIISPTQVSVHVCTSSETFATGAVDAYGLLGPGPTYILKKAEVVSPSVIGQSRHLSVSSEVAGELGIVLTG